MIRVVLMLCGEADPDPTWLDGDVRAVPAEPFLGDADSGQGGITLADIVDATMIAPLSTFPVGASVYIESEDPTDFLMDETPEVEQSSHIWWLGTIMGE